MRIQLIIYAVLFFLAALYPQSQNFNGIKFNSLNVQRLQRTSILLNDENPLKLSESFSISFQISFWNPEYYGPIIRVDDEQGNEVRLVYNNYKSKKYSSITLSINNLNQQIQFYISEKSLIRNNWFKVKLTFDRLKKYVKLYFDNNYKGLIPFSPQNKDYFNIVFGLKELKNIRDPDLPGMCIKNILITEQNKTKYFWSLDPRESTKDEISGSELKIVNPNWVYKDHQYWRQLASINISKTTIPYFGVAFDSSKSRLFIDASDRLIIYNLNNGEDSIIKYKNRSPAKWNDLFYDQKKQVLYSYKTGMGKVSIYDIHKNEWTINDTSENISGHYFGSAKFSYPNHDNLYLLGGYGWNNAKKDLFHYNFKNKAWEKVNLKKNDMSPRAWFAFGKGFNEGEYLIYGGLGNESGNQDHGFKNYYDFFILNMNDSTISRVNLPKQSNFPYYLLMNDFYLDKSNSSIYFISVLEENKSFPVILNRLDLKTGALSQLGNKFWKRNGSKWIYSDLYYNKTTSELISVIFDSTNVDIYAISYPIIKDSNNFLVAQQSDNNFDIYYVLFAIGIISIAAISFLLFKKKLNNKYKNRANQNTTITNITSDNKFLRNSLKLFGGFHLYNVSSKDIITEFSPKLKETFLLILLKSFNHYQPKGITSEELSSIIWPDYSPDSVKSNRGVTINKIRKVLFSVDGMDLEFQNKLWSISLSNGFTCDYLEFLKLKSLYNNSKKGFITLTSLSEIVLGGEFLKGISHEWLDSMKFSINSEVIAFLKQFFEFEEIKNDQEKIIRLCDIILSFDSVDTDAIKFKIKTLTSQGKLHIAKSTFGLFVAEYKRLYDENYPLSFEEIIKS